MLKVIAKTIVGMISLVAGFGIAYFYLINIDNGSSALLLIPALCIIILGIFILMHAGKLDDTVVQRPNKETLSPTTPVPQESLMERNNELTQKWLRTNEKRDKLRLLEMAANAEEDSSQNG